MIEQLGVSPKHYGFLFAIAIAGYLVSASFGPKLNDRLGREKSTLIAWGLLVAGTLLSLITGWLSEGTSVTGYIAGIVLYELGLGIFMPLCQARATEHMKTNIGTASGLIFFIEMLLATLISSLVSLLPVSGTLSLSAITVLAVCLATVCLMKARKHPQSAEHHA
jgi:DHA1 family bicyclomycin/chloramphenicol resistance-like MFS transporter